MSIIETALPLDKIHSLFENATALMGAVGFFYYSKKLNHTITEVL
jgi:hypothetical protein